MADGNGSIVNPVTGNEGHSVETAADDFTAMLAEEGRTDRRRREDEGKPARQSPAEADAAATREAGQSERQPAGERRDREEGPDDRDPILDDGPLEDDDQAKGDDAEDPDADDQDPDDQDDDEAEGDPLDAEYDVKVNGETKKVTLRDALASYSMETDYRQKTERNAREYEEIQDYAKDTVQTRARTDQTLQFAMDLIEQLQPSKEDWDTLEKADPQGFIAAQKHWNGLLGKAREIHQARLSLNADQAKEAERATGDYLKKQEEILLRDFPALRDEKKRNAFHSHVMAYGKKAGYTEQELHEGATDARALMTLYKAAMYDRARDSQKAAGRQASGNAPKNAPTTPRNPDQRGKRSAVRNADRRLQRSGSLQDAAASFSALISSE